MRAYRVLCGDVLDVLPTLPAESVQCCVTSPPYWGLRDYGTEGQLGLEPTPEEYVAKLVAVFREVRRVLRDDGAVWLNLGDSYSGGGGYAPDAPVNVARRAEGSGVDGKFRFSPRVHDRQAVKPKVQTGLKPKDLVGIPWRVAFALQADGWYLRSEIIWAKPNPMPESVTDRPTKAHEQVFLLSKSPRYYFDQEAVREANTRDWSGERGLMGMSAWADDAGRNDCNRAKPPEFNPAGRNIRSVWTIATQPYAEAHFATFPPALVEPCIKAGSAEGQTVLDPFGGSGTTGMVANRLNRNAVLVELNPEYAEMARQRIHSDAPLLNVEVT